MSDDSGSGSESVTLHFIALTRTRNWEASTARARRDELDEGVAQPYSVSGARPEIIDSKGALVRFTGDAGSLRRVREYAARHAGSVRVLP
jgi:hypothetical protein